MSERPTGITIAAILTGLGSILALGYGAEFATIVYFINTLPLVPMASFSIFIGISNLITAYGMWKGLIWARWLAIIVIGLVAFEELIIMSEGMFLELMVPPVDIASMIVLPIGIAFIIIEMLILWYLIQPHVEAFFGDTESLPDYLALVLIPIPFASLAYGLLGSPNVLARFIFCTVAAASAVIEILLTNYLARRHK